MSDQRPVVERMENDPRIAELPYWARDVLAGHAWRHSLPGWESTRELYEFAVSCVQKIQELEGAEVEMVAPLPRKPLSTQHVSATFVQENNEEE